MRARMYADYDRPFREEAVNLVLNGDRTIEQVAIDLGVSGSTLRRWDKFEMAKRKGVQPKKGSAQKRPLPVADPAKETPEEKIARLEQENAQLRKENASLQMDRAI